MPVSERWLDELISPFTDPTVGAVGPLLLYPNEKVQHAGMFMGYRGAAGHTLRHIVLPEGDYCFMGMAEREVTCVTGAALVIRRQIFDDLNGFDSQLDTIFQDVDLCLRIGGLGFKVLYNPRSVLLHMESVSILPTLERPGDAEQRGRQHQYLLSRYSEARLSIDPFVNPAQSRHDETLRTLTA